MNVIRRLDNYNFILATELEEPKVVKIKDKEIIYRYKNMERYYGNMYYAIRGLCRLENVECPNLPSELKNIKPSSDPSTYVPFVEVRVDQIIKVLG